MTIGKKLNSTAVERKQNIRIKAFQLMNKSRHKHSPEKGNLKKVATK